MKLSLNLWTTEKMYGEFSDEECIEILKNAGFEGVDFPLCGWENEIETLFSEEFGRWAVRFAEKLRANGMCIAQTHLPFLPSHYPPIGDGSFEAFAEVYIPLVARTLELTRAVGCDIAVLHLYIAKNAEETLAFNKKYIDALKPYCERYGVKIAFETIFGWSEKEGIIPCGIATEEEMLRYVEYGGSEYFGICLDTGHELLLGGDPVELIKAFGDRLIALHVNSNPGSKRRDDVHLVPNTMQWSEPVRWTEVSAALREIGYQGSYNMELIVPYGTPKQALPAFVSYAGAVGRYYADLAE